MIIIFNRQFNANAVIENHMQSCGSSINKIVQLSDINNHYNFSPSGIFMPSNLPSGFILQENASLVTNFSDQKLLVTIITNLDTSLQSKKIIGY